MTHYEQLGQLKICVEKTLNMPLTESNVKKIFDIKVASNKVSAVPDVYHDLKSSSNPKSLQAAHKLRAAFITSKLWKKGSTINIFIMPGSDKVPRTKLADLENSKDSNGNPLKMDPLQKEIDSMSVPDAIKKIVNERYSPILDLKLNFVDDQNSSDVRISFVPDDGAWSLIGTDILVTDKKDATMNLGWFDVGTTLHEFGHTFGMIHEHQNPSGNPIQWNEQKVYTWAQDTQGWDQKTTYTNIIEKYDANTINGSKFDPQSIMLYFFPASLTTNNEGTHENLRLSPEDVIYLNQQYPGSTEDPATFYKEVYGEDIKDAEKNDTPAPNQSSGGNSFSSSITSKIKSNPVLYIIIGIAILLFIITIIVLLLRH